jgi:hypothetical protein
LGDAASSLAPSHRKGMVSGLAGPKNARQVTRLAPFVERSGRAWMLA